ncbi:hypothetical protein CYANOKiyG1_27790 [Okeania sp. KiyG1]|nr:hypothetical protein CYANOKiyG1_27790 [Okeania sp. KiyG1]
MPNVKDVTNNLAKSNASSTAELPNFENADSLVTNLCLPSSLVTVLTSYIPIEFNFLNSFSSIIYCAISKGKQL